MVKGESGLMVKVTAVSRSGRSSWTASKNARDVKQQVYNNFSSGVRSFCVRTICTLIRTPKYHRLL